jgi:hypothetical protein
VVTPPPATEEFGAMGREIKSRQGAGWQLLKNAIFYLAIARLAPRRLHARRAERSTVGGKPRDLPVGMHQATGYIIKLPVLSLPSYIRPYVPFKFIVFILLSVSA